MFGIPVPGGPIFDLCKDAGLTCPLAVGLPATASVVYGVSKLVPAGIDATVRPQPGAPLSPAEPRGAPRSSAELQGAQRN